MAEYQTFYQELGQRIREAREKSHLTQEALAVKLSLTRTSITNIEKGRQQLLVHTLVQIAKALQVEPESLLLEPSLATNEIEDLIKTESQTAQEWIRAALDKE